ncbi:SIMPL domain-containing protein [Marinobacter sp. VGCF2001]|uniref:SIMPL domain-containing protein n=1 Tax=Marinobacter sp. VGCF2001 TaxID=3417189 RepID=UPI003CED5B63
MVKFRSVMALTAALSVLPLTVNAGELSLNGQGIVRYEPDSARLQFTAMAEHDNAATATEQVSAMMAQWREAIAGYRDELNDYSDANLSVYTRTVPSREQNQPPEQRSVARQTVSFSVQNLELLNRLISSANEVGLQYHLGSQMFFHSDEPALEREALARAIKDARKRCDFAAEQLDMRCGDVVSMNINGGHRPAPVMMAESKMAGDAVSSVGPREIQASVSATFELD